MTCPTNLRHEYVAPDLAVEQTLENLEKFSDRLDRAHEVIKAHGRCQCKD